MGYSRRRGIWRAGSVHLLDSDDRACHHIPKLAVVYDMVDDFLPQDCRSCVTVSQSAGYLRNSFVQMSMITSLAVP